MAVSRFNVFRFERGLIGNLASGEELVRWELGHGLWCALGMRARFSLVLFLSLALLLSSSGFQDRGQEKVWHCRHAAFVLVDPKLGSGNSTAFSSFTSTCFVNLRDWHRNATGACLFHVDFGHSPTEFQDAFPPSVRASCGDTPVTMHVNHVLLV